MDKQIDTLISSAGGSNRYQVMLLIIAFFIWQSLSLHNTSLAMLEKTPTIKYNLKDANDTEIEELLSYDLCDAKNFTTVKSENFSWVIELEISCDQAKVGLIGSFVFAGMLAGTLIFSVLNKFLTHRTIVIYAVGTYIALLCSVTFIFKFYYLLVCLLFLSITNVLSLFSTMSIVGESVSSEKRSLFTSILNMGYSLCPITYTYLYVLLDSWRIIFYIQNIVAVVALILFIIIVNNSPRMYFSKNQINEGIETLKKIAKFNGKLEEFEEKLKDPEFDNLLRNESKGVEKDIPTELKQELGYSALIKYPSVRYKFLIFGFMFMTTVFLTNAVVLGAKTMEGNMYLNIISLFSVEIVSCFTSGLIINWPPMGRKKGLILFYFGVIVGFVFFVLFQNFGFNEYWQLGAMAIIRSAITSVFTTFYIYIMENYPTPIRSLGFGLNSALGNVMGIASPIIIEYFSATILYIIFGILCTINCLLTFFLKETVGQPMQETIEELNEEDVDKERLIPKNDDGEKGEEGKEDKKEEKDIETKKDEKKEEEKKEEETKEGKNEDDKKEEEKPLLDNNENADAINEPDDEN